jgi:hypothetical protein
MQCKLQTSRDPAVILDLFFKCFLILRQRISDFQMVTDATWLLLLKIFLRSALTVSTTAVKL